MKKLLTVCMLTCFLFHSLHAACFFTRGTLRTPSLYAQGIVKKTNPIISCFLAGFTTFKQSRLAQKITGASILAAAGYAAYRLFNYVWYTSNKSVQYLINHNHEIYTRALEYQPLINILTRAHEQRLKKLKSCSQGDEDILSELMYTKNKSYETLMSDLNRILQTLALDKAKTQVTLKKLTRNNNSSPEQITLYRNLENSLQQLATIELNLKVLKDYMTHHQKSIELYEHALTLDEALTRIAPYVPMICDLYTRYGDISHRNIQTIVIDEHILNEFAAAHPNMEATIQALESIITSLENTKNSIDAKLQFIQNPHQKIRESLANTEHQLPYLRTLKAFLMHHRDYFAFYTQEIKLINRYGNGSEPIPLPSNSLYPHIEVVAGLERDLAAFNPIKQKIATLYPARGQELGTIEYRLRQQIIAIVKSQSYQEELRRRKEDEDRQQMLLEQRRLANAQERQAQETRHIRLLQQETLQEQTRYTQEMVRFNSLIQTIISRLNESHRPWGTLSASDNPTVIADNLEQLARTVRTTYRTHMR
jgi:hypothetical protein